MSNSLLTDANLGESVVFSAPFELLIAKASNFTHLVYLHGPVDSLCFSTYLQTVMTAIFRTITLLFHQT